MAYAPGQEPVDEEMARFYDTVPEGRDVGTYEAERGAEMRMPTDSLGYGMGKPIGAGPSVPPPPWMQPQQPIPSNINIPMPSGRVPIGDPRFPANTRQYEPPSAGPPPQFAGPTIPPAPRMPPVTRPRPIGAAKDGPAYQFSFRGEGGDEKKMKLTGPAAEKAYAELEESGKAHDKALKKAAEGGPRADDVLKRTETDDEVERLMEAIWGK